MAKRNKLCVLTTHPIQYMVPWFRSLAADPEIDLEVIYLRELNPAQQGVGFGQAFQWDVPLRDGYVSRVLGVPVGLKNLPRLAVLLNQNLREIRPDAVLVTGWNEPGLATAYPVLRLMGIPVIVRGESNSLRHRSLISRLFHRLLLHMGNAVVVIGKANRQFYVNNGVPNCRIFDGAYFVDSERMTIMAEAHALDGAELRAEMGICEGDFVFAFSGKHVPFKRPMMLVEAGALLRSQGRPVSLLFAGSGELTDALRERAEDLGVPAVFAGFLNQTEMWKAYVPADAFVLPSTNRETWGLVTNEAMLFGLPVIVSDQVGCGPDLVVENETGYVFSGDSESLAQSMEKLMANPEHARQMGQAGRQHVLENYSMQVATRGLKMATQAVCS